MRLLIALCFALVMALPAPPSRAQNINDTAMLARVLTDIKNAQALNHEMDIVFVNLVEASGAFDQVMMGQYSLEAAVTRGQNAVQSTAASIERFQREAPGLHIERTGDPSFDQLIEELLRFVKDKPPMLARIREIVAGQIAAAEAGDFSEIDRLATQLGREKLAQTDNETTMMRLQLATTPRDDPQYALIAAMVASQEGMRGLVVVGVETDPGKRQAGLEAIPGGMRAAADKMRRIITDGRATIARQRGGASDVSLSQIFDTAQDIPPAIENRLLEIFSDGLDLEQGLADHLDLGAELFARIAEGEQSDALGAQLVAWDERYSAIVMRRMQQAANVQEALAPLR